MKKNALIFLLAIFVPALLLGGLVLRTASQQRIIIEQQETELRQSEADRVAERVRAAIDGEQKAFARAVEQLVKQHGAKTAASNFTFRLAEAWPRKCIGFATNPDGRILSPTQQVAQRDARLRDFLRENASFIGGQIAAEVYQQAERDGLNQHYEIAQKEEPFAQLEKLKLQQQTSAQMRNVAPQKAQTKGSEPQQLVSQLNIATSRFSQLVSSERGGLLARFVDDALELIFWVRPEDADGMVFGAQIDPRDLRDVIEPIVRGDSPSSGSAPNAACIAMLDDRAKPFALSIPGFSANWRTPFVATEIGEALPHWEVALYLVDPARLSRSARLVNYTLLGLIALALGAIAWGSALIVTDTRRQLALVQKKTDFVSNVSHELKTPLTSIRMFAELLHEKRVHDPEKVSSYLRIITLESERLTRLINNVLDFAKTERGEKRYDKRAIDLHALLAKVWEAQELHLRGQGFEALWQAASPPYSVFGDEDALAQVIVNLLSNAEKYHGEIKTVEMHSYLDKGRIFVSVLDRGLGVPAGEERKIFEHFYRAHDSLSSGIQGSGLGLTLAKKIAEEHGGTIRYARRPGGGSNFTLELPEHPFRKDDQ